MQRDANSIARHATRRKPIASSVLAPMVTPYMKLVQALLPMSRTNGAPRSPWRARAAATICCERPGKPWVLDEETITASSCDHGSSPIRRSSSSSPTATGDSSGSKKRRARRPVFFSMSCERSRTLATMSSAASSSIWTSATRRSPISALETTASGNVLAVLIIDRFSITLAPRGGQHAGAGSRAARPLGRRSGDAVGAASGSVAQHGEEVKPGPEHHEAVPDGMGVAPARIEQEEHYARRIRNATGDEQGDARKRHALDQQ